MEETGWFADKRTHYRGAYPWYPSLQLPGVCLRLEIGHPTKESCEDFIRDQVIGQPMLPDPEGPEAP